MLWNKLKLLFTTILVNFCLVTIFPAQAAKKWERCPKNLKAKSLEKWRSKLIKQVIKKNYKKVQSAITSCFPATPPKCYGDLLYYADLKANPDDYPQLEYDQDDEDEDEEEAEEDVLLNKNELTLKSEADLPPEFLARDKAGKVISGEVNIPDNIEEIAKKKNWDTLLYKTRGTGGFNDGGNLFIVAISTPKVDIIIQSSPKPDKNPEKTANNPLPKPSNPHMSEAQDTLTVITIDKTKKPPVGQLRKLIKYDGKNYSWSNTTKIQDCIGCHASPLRPISPRGYKHVNHEDKMSPEQSAKTDAINKLLNRSGVSWGTSTGKNNDKKKIRLGPPIDSYPTGWAPKNFKTRTKDFIKKCSIAKDINYKGFDKYKVKLSQNKPPKINWRRVRNGMKCFKCHNNTKRGILHEDFSMDENIFKIAIDHSVPPDVDLNDDERLALVSCLKAERSILKKEWRKRGKWMEQSTCLGDQFDGKPPVRGKNEAGKFCFLAQEKSQPLPKIEEDGAIEKMFLGCLGCHGKASNIVRGKYMSAIKQEIRSGHNSAGEIKEEKDREALIKYIEGLKAKAGVKD